MISIPRMELSTHKLFHAHPSLRKTTALVTYVEENAIALDRTVFYAESGGQVSDRGRIDALDVKAVSKHGGRPVKIARDGLDAIYVNTGTYFLHHFEDRHPFEVGQEVSLAIDWDHRWKTTRHHTAAHFLFHAIDAVLQKRCDTRIMTRGCVIRDDACRFDIANAVAPDHLAEIQDIVDTYLAGGHGIAMRPDPTCDDVFHWTSAGIDIPCGGTHVASTDDLGRLKLARRAKGRNTMRITGQLS